MTNTMAATRGYSALSEFTRSNRDLEYEVILGVTRELKRVGDAAAGSFPRLVAALNRNERLWTEIGVQVADTANQLDPTLRARLFFIAEFVAQHTAQVLQTRSGIEALIEINLSVLRGLKGEAG